MNCKIIFSAALIVAIFAAMVSIAVTWAILVTQIGEAATVCIFAVLVICAIFARHHLIEAVWESRRDIRNWSQPQQNNAVFERSRVASSTQSAHISLQESNIVTFYEDGMPIRVIFD